MYLGIDLGTSGVKAVLMDSGQNIIASGNGSLDVQRPHSGWSEQLAEDWITATREALGQLKQSHPRELSAVRGIGLSGQQHGATLLDKANKPLRPCILWNDTRSTVEAAVLDTTSVRALAGSIIFPGFTAPKMLWVKEHEPALFDQTKTVLLPKDYLRYWLTGELVSDMSDSSGTGWLDVAKREWSDELLAAGSMRREQMPSLVEGSETSGQIRSALAQELGIDAAAVVAGGGGDNAASACGMGIVQPGNAFLSLGTSGVVFAANESFKPNPDSAIHTFCHAVPDTWHQMGVILSATDSLNWLANLVSMEPATLTDALGDTVRPPSATHFLPYLGGERTPHNNAQIRGSLTGLEHVTDRDSLTHAVLSGVSFAFRDNLAALEQAGTTLERVTAVGGGSKSAYWLKLLATILKMPVDTTSGGDVGASLGAARLGLIAADNANPLEICTEAKVQHTYEPDLSLAAEYDDAYEQFRAVYPAVAPLSASS